MIRLEQPKLSPEAVNMAVEIEILPLQEPDQRVVYMHLRYMIENRVLFELDSSINPCLSKAPLYWLEKALVTRRESLSEKFGHPAMGEHLICIEQTTISKETFQKIQEQRGEDAYPYPFEYDIDVMVNPDPKGLFFAGVGMRICGLSHVQISNFLNQIHDEVIAVWSGGAWLAPKLTRKPAHAG